MFFELGAWIQKFKYHTWHFIVRELDTNCPRAYEHTTKKVVKQMCDPLRSELVSGITGGE
jgi:hypothetical protein